MSLGADTAEARNTELTQGFQHVAHVIWRPVEKLATQQHERCIA
jgi:hypothetical protein